MAIEPKILDDVLAGCKTPEDVGKLYSQLLQRMINRSLDAEMDAHLGYDKNEKSANDRRRQHAQRQGRQDRQRRVW